MSRVPIINAQLDAIAQALEVIAIAQSKGIDGDIGYDGMAQLVKSGLGAKAFPVGTTINIAKETAVSITVSGTGITAATVDEETFINAEHESGSAAYEFKYDGAAWRNAAGQVIELESYGISVTGTAADGDTIIVHETAANIPSTVLDHDYDTPVNPAIPHTLTIAMQNCYENVQFDAAEALIYCPDGLTAGTRYYITADHAAHNGGTDQDGDFGFTPTQDVPAGGYVRHSVLGVSQSGSYTKAQVLAGKFITYGTDFIQIEQLATDEGTEGTYLGKTTANDPAYLDSNYTNVNFTQRNANGSNDWETSNLRQYLNAVGTGWWVQKTKWSFPPANVDTLQGFLNGIDPALREHMQTVKKRVATSVADRPGGTPLYKDVEDKVFILSQTEVNLGQNNSQYETSWGLDNTLKTTPYAYYVGADNADLVKLLAGSPRHWWLRGPSPASAGGVRHVSTGGSLGDIRAGNGIGLEAACVIG